MTRERDTVESRRAEVLHVALLTGAHDATYAHGLTRTLVGRGIRVDFIGSDLLDAPFLHKSPLIAFRNLRGNQSEDAPFVEKARRLTLYYFRLVRYAVVSEASIFHILWNNKIEWLDRTVLMLLYRLCGRRVVLTAHNINAAARDGRDTTFKRWTLRYQYRKANHVFVHTRKMREELEQSFDVPPQRISVIPFGINDEAPRSGMTRTDARKSLGIENSDQVGLIFGQIANYKGIEYAVDALPILCERCPNFRLVIAGKVKCEHELYWADIQRMLLQSPYAGRVLLKLGYIPDCDIEMFFSAADVLAMPYVRIYQSGLPFLAYSFGLPVVCTDAGSLSEVVVEGVTGYVCGAADAGAFASAMERFFASPLGNGDPGTRSQIREFAMQRYSWERVADITSQAYGTVRELRES